MSLCINYAVAYYYDLSLFQDQMQHKAITLCIQFENQVQSFQV